MVAHHPTTVAMHRMQDTTEPIDRRMVVTVLTDRLMELGTELEVASVTDRLIRRTTAGLGAVTGTVALECIRQHRFTACVDLACRST